MPRDKRFRLNFLGVIALLVGVAAFAAPFVPQLAVGPLYGGTRIGLLGAALGLLAVLISAKSRNLGGGMPVLAVLVSLGAIAFDNRGWFGNFMPGKDKPAAVAPAPTPVVPSAPVAGNTAPKSNNIFDIGSGNSGSSPDIHTNPGTPSHEATPASPAVIHPASPAIPEAVYPTLQAARADFDAAWASVERSLANDPAYRQAKADFDDSAAQRKKVLDEEGAGSPASLSASQKWIDAKTKLQQIIAAAGAKNSAYRAAQKELAEAQAHQRGGKGN